MDNYEFTAKQARDRLNSRTVDLTNVFNAIEQACDNGLESVRITHQVEYRHRHLAVKKLEALGYAVTMESGHDQRDGAWCVINISW